LKQEKSPEEKPNKKETRIGGQGTSGYWYFAERRKQIYKGNQV
jgi:hypothetical protein